MGGGPIAQPGSRKKDWALSQEAFEKLLACLDADRDRAAHQYERIRQRLLKFFTWRGCSTPEDHADRTIDRVARRLAEGADLYVTDPYLYFHGVALNVLKEHWRDPTADERALEELQPSVLPFVSPSTQTDAAQADRERRLECLDACLAGLAPADRRLVVRYHQGEKGARIRARKELAEALAVPMSTLRIRVFRIRAGLEICVETCLKRSGSGDRAAGL